MQERTIGTSYYASSLNYLGYSPFADPEFTAGATSYDDVHTRMAVQPSLGTLSKSEMKDWIRHQIIFLKQKVQDTGNELDKCRQEQEAFSVEYYTTKETIRRYEHHVQQFGEQHFDSIRIKAEKESMEKNIKLKYYNLTNQRQSLLNALVSHFQVTKDVQSHVLDKELIDWKRNQQLAGNGYPLTGCLDTLQEWCEALAGIVWTMRQQIRQLEVLQDKVNNPSQTSPILSNLLAGITELLSNLVTGTFIIEKQPPQVMKTNTKFTATVRLLVGSVLNVHMAAPAVTVSIVSETQANQLLTAPANIPKLKEDYNSGDILNGQGTMEYHAATKQVSVTFRNLQLKKIKRTEKKGTESVMDEKFSVLFWTEFLVGELKFQLWTMSLPVVVIVHGNQEPQALATITWDNAFADWGRRPFNIPDKVTWRQMGSALNMKWAGACGSPLTDDNLYYLACKVTRDNNLSRKPDEFNNSVVTWTMFCKEPLPERNFTFWEWFYKIYILTSNQLSRLWKEGLIMGFVTKHAAESMLLQMQSGCFLLRFSDSELGGITIAYLRHPDPFQTPIVSMVAPFTVKDLAQRSMSNVIFDLQELSVLYPDISKEVFKKFCSSPVQCPISRPSDGYVKHTLVTQVEGCFSTCSESNPSTPATNCFAGMDTPERGSNFTQSPLSTFGGPRSIGTSFGGADDMEMDDGSVDIVDSIDVRQVLGLNPDFLQD